MPKTSQERRYLSLEGARTLLAHGTQWNVQLTAVHPSPSEIAQQLPEQLESPCYRVPA